MKKLLGHIYCINSNEKECKIRPKAQDAGYDLVNKNKISIYLKIQDVKKLEARQDFELHNLYASFFLQVKKTLKQSSYLSATGYLCYFGPSC